MLISKIIFCKILLIFTVTVGWTEALKVNVEGSVSLGKEVMDTISYYMNMFKENRRSPNIMKKGLYRRSGTAEVTSLDNVIREADLCKGLSFCSKIPDLVEKYVISNKRSVESAFLDIFGDTNIFSKPSDLEDIIKDIKEILVEADTQPGTITPGAIWITAMKKINARFQKEARLFVKKFFISGKKSPEEKHAIERNITHVMVPKVAFAEASTENFIYTKLQLFANKEYYICTSVINDVLLAMNQLSEDKVRSFAKMFYESLYFTKFSNILEKSTSTALHSIVMDTTFTDKVSMKEIIASVQKTVEDRLRLLDGHQKFVEVPKDPDIQLLQAVLSDLDNLMVANSGLFTTFLDNFKYWLEHGGEVQTLIKQFLMDVNDALVVLPEPLITKLSWNTRVFLELTVE